VRQELEVVDRLAGVLQTHSESHARISLRVGARGRGREDAKEKRDYAASSVESHIEILSLVVPRGPAVTRSLRSG
jgi:hypothetical protein